MKLKKPCDECLVNPICKIPYENFSGFIYNIEDSQCEKYNRYIYCTARITNLLCSISNEVDQRRRKETRANNLILINNIRKVYNQNLEGKTNE